LHAAYAHATPGAADYAGATASGVIRMSRYASFREFYPFYLNEHSDIQCRRMHFIGSTLVLAVIALALLTASAWWLLLAPVAGYGFAWIGHYVFEENRPATFTHPLYSLMGDWVMYWEILRGKVKI
jgi:hypothetical protein